MYIPKEFIQDPRLPETAKNLLSRLRTQELTQTQFLTECAYWALNDGFDELRQKPYPTKPIEADELENMIEDQRSKFNYLDYFNRNPRVKEYYDRKAQVKNINEANIAWLKEMLSYVPEDDVVSRSKIKNRISGLA